ncbi:hypothetical protein ACFYMA_21455 [Streptomyces iakyrus]|uniref:hypothetical protein n=1 Tax=Streptomyces iakyrus TaxID=68219 RepID=UPI00367F3738
MTEPPAHERLRLRVPQGPLDERLALLGEDLEHLPVRVGSACRRQGPGTDPREPYRPPQIVDPVQEGEQDEQGRLGRIQVEALRPVLGRLAEQPLDVVRERGRDPGVAPGVLLQRPFQFVAHAGQPGREGADVPPVVAGVPALRHVPPGAGVADPALPGVQGDGCGRGNRNRPHLRSS